MDRKTLEAKLSKVLVPVEPNQRFTRRLRARLVTYQGESIFSGWFIFLVLATAILIMVASFGLVIRLLLGFVSIIGLIGHRRQTSQDRITLAG
jgi:hypothetical protein